MNIVDGSESNPAADGGAPKAGALGLSRCFLLLSALLLVGCYPWTLIRDFHPLKTEKPVIMFDKYVLDMYGHSDSTESSCTFECGVKFVKRMPATVPFGSVPIFTIDSFCFEGRCLESVYCRAPIGFDELAKRRSQQSGYPPYKPQASNTDIGWDEEHIWPYGFVIWEDIQLPMGCEDRDVDVIVHACLVDRANGQVIGRESKRVPFVIKWGRSYYNTFD